MLDQSTSLNWKESKASVYQQMDDVLGSYKAKELLDLSRSLRERSYDQRPGTVWQDEPKSAIRSAKDYGGAGRSFGLLTFHPNGYVREEALHIVVQRRTEWGLRYILLRQADWVPQVRGAAEEAFTVEVKRASAQEIVESLPFLEDIEGRAGDFRHVRAAIIERLRHDPDGKNQLRRAMGHSDALLRIVVLRTAISSDLLSRLELIQSLLDNADAGLTRLPVEVLRDCSWGELSAELLNGLSRTRNRFLRLEALRWIVRHAPEKHLLPVLQAALLDPVRSIQWCAEFNLQKRDRSLVREGYAAALRSDDVTQLRAALRGAGHFRLSEEQEVIRGLCSHPKAKVRAAALQALSRIDSEANHDIFLQAMDNGSARLRTRALRIVYRMGFEECCRITVRQLRERGLGESHPKDWLGLIAHLPKRDRLCCLLIALRSCTPALFSDVSAQLGRQLNVGVSTDFEAWQRDEIELCLAKHGRLLTAQQAVRLKELLQQYG